METYKIRLVRPEYKTDYGEVIPAKEETFEIEAESWEAAAYKVRGGPHGDVRYRHWEVYVDDIPYRSFQ